MAGMMRIIFQKWYQTAPLFFRRRSSDGDGVAMIHGCKDDATQ
jgi:hypothetical protein|tara:strand:+ start:143 stop:271 length:129 start_codon:yes stop_codon:yes gene_type:complete